MNYPSEKQARRDIAEVGRRMYEQRFVAANDGNISCKIAPDALIATPTMVSKGFMTEEMLIATDMEGNLLEKSEFKPSSELKMHLRAYKENPEIAAVTHAHPPFSSAFAIAGIALDRALMPEAVVNLGPVPVAKYAHPGSTEVPDSIAPFVHDYNAVLLANHGVLTWGGNLFDAFFKLESVEYYAKITMYTDYILGKANILSVSQMEKLLETKKALGITRGALPKGAATPQNDKDVLPGSAEHTRSLSDADIDAIAKRVAELIK